MTAGGRRPLPGRRRPLGAALLAAASVAVAGCTQPLARMIVEPSAGSGLFGGEVAAFGERFAPFRDLLTQDFGADTLKLEGVGGTRLHAFVLEPGDYGLEWSFRWGDDGSWRFNFSFDADSLDVGSPPEPRGTAVFLHGLYAGALQLLPQALSFAERGYRVVLMDLRAHGQSGGEYVTFGVREGGDLAAAVDQLRERGRIAPPLVLYGTSLGATVALHGAGAGVPADRVVVVAPMAEPREVIAEAGPEMLPGFVRPLLTEGRIDAALDRAEEIAGFSFEQASAAAAAPYVDAPVLLVHGRGDDVVPVGHSVRLHRALPCSTLRRLERYGHGSLMMAPGATADSVLAWLGREVACGGVPTGPEAGGSAPGDTGRTAAPRGPPGPSGDDQ